MHTKEDLDNINSFILVLREAYKYGLTHEVLTDMCEALDITTEDLAAKANGAAMDWDIQESNMSKYISAEDNHMKYDTSDIVVSGTVYADGNPCILINGAEDDAPVAKATINIP